MRLRPSFEGVYIYFGQGARLAAAGRGRPPIALELIPSGGGHYNRRDRVYSPHPHPAPDAPGEEALPSPPPARAGPHRGCAPRVEPLAECVR